MATHSRSLGQASQVDTWLDSVGLGMVKAHVRKAKVFKILSGWLKIDCV